MASAKLTILALAAVFLRTVASQATASYCAALTDVISICELQTQGFDNYPLTQKASCFCDSTLGTIAWGPSSFDGLASNCALEYATIDVEVASDASILAGLCTATALPTTIANQPVDYCSALVDAISICEVQTQGFTDLPAIQQASCLCGSTLGTIAWGPASFDGLASACAVEYATIDVTVAHDASQLAGFCTTVVAQSTTVSNPIAFPTTVTVTASATTIYSPTHTPHGLSTGAKAGIGVGAALGALLLIGLLGAFILLKRRRARRELQSAPAPAPAPAPTPAPAFAPAHAPMFASAPAPAPAFAPGSPAPPPAYYEKKDLSPLGISELPQNIPPRSELVGSQEFPRREFNTIETHELE